MKTHVTGEPRTTIAEIAYRGSIYRDAVGALEPKFRQTRAVVSAHLTKVSHFPALKKHMTDNIISFSAAISSLFEVLWSLHYLQDLTSGTLLDQVVQKSSSNLKEALAMHTAKNKRSRPTLLDLNDQLKEKAEAHERMNITSVKPNSDGLSPAIKKPKPLKNRFASTSKADAPTAGRSSIPTEPVRCTDCKETHPLWSCPIVPAGTPTETPEVIVQTSSAFRA